MTASQANRSDAARPGEGPRPPRSGDPPSAPDLRAPGNEPPKPLPPDVHEVLSGLSAALQKHMMYPEDHPARGAGLGRLVDELGEVLEDRGHLSIRARKGRLWVDGRASDPDKPLIRSLSERLHEHHVLSLDFRRGIGAAELEGFLERLGREPESLDGPLGLASREIHSLWPHIQIEPLRYDPLEIGDRAEGVEAEDVWLTDVKQHFSTGLGGSDLVDKSPESVAEQLDAEVGKDEYRDRMIASQLFRLAEQLSQARGRDAVRLRKRMTKMVLQLQPETMSRLLEVGGEGGRGDKFLVDSADAMDVEAVVELIQAAAEHRSEDVAPPLLRMMSKLAMYTKGGPNPDRPGEEGAVRNLVRGMVEGWHLENPAPSTYESFLDQMSHLPPSVGVSDGDESQEEGVLDPERMVQMGLELDEVAPAVDEAAQRLILHQRADDLARMLEEAPASEEVAPRLWKKMAHPRVIRQLLQRSPPAGDVLHKVAEREGPRMAGPLLEVLALSGSRSLRRLVFEVLIRIGEPVVEHVPQWLDHERWFVRRNMLALLHELSAWPEDTELSAYAHDPDPRVRVEAFKVALEVWPDPDAVVRTALADDDERVIGLAVAAAERAPPEGADEHLVRHARNPRLADSLRTAAVRALGLVGSAEARQTCVDLVRRRHWLFWHRLASPTPVVVTALEVLAKRWPDHPEVREVLEAAAGSDEPAHREAVEAAP